MHHFPAGPSLSARVLAAISRWGRLLWRCVPTRPGRLAFALLVTTMVTGLVLAVPVVSGTHLSKHPVALDASSSSPQAADGGSPVVMGQDGAPVAAGTATGSAGDPSATSAAPDATVTAPQDTLPAETPSASAPLDASTAPGPAPAGTTPAPKPPMLPGTRAPAPRHRA